MRDGGHLSYFPHAFEAFWFEQLRDDLVWEEEFITIFGKTQKVPRLSTYFGEFDYGYSTVKRKAAPLPDWMLPLKEAVEKQANFTFNSVLGNYYRQGQDSMGWHADNEPEMDTRCIASVSFGATRRFLMRHHSKEDKWGFNLEGGSLLLMKNCQETWQHSVPKTRRAVGERINLTFRRIVPR